MLIVMCRLHTMQYGSNLCVCVVCRIHLNVNHYLDTKSCHFVWGNGIHLSFIHHHYDDDDHGAHIVE